MAFSGDNLAAADFALPRSSAAGNTAGGTAGLNKLWLPLWSGEVIHAYDQYNMFESCITHKPLSGGFSWDFPITGTVGLVPSWDAGVELGGGTSSSNTLKVVLDKRPMASHFETDNIDALISQWDYRQQLAVQAGQRLANTRDRQLAEALCVAAILSPFSGDPRGSLSFPAPAVVNTATAVGNQVAVNNTSELSALNILQAIENYMVHMQQNDFPCVNVMCCVTPKTFQVIRSLGVARQASELTKNPLFGGSATYGGAGAQYTVGLNNMTDSLEYMGAKIVKSNHLPGGQDYYTTNTIGSAKYNLKWDTGPDIFGVIFQADAVAGLSLVGMKVDSVQDIRRNTQFTVASMMKGTGILRPELCQLLVGINTTAAVDTSEEIDSRSEIYGYISGASSTNLSAGFGAEYAATSTYA